MFVFLLTCFVFRKLLDAFRYDFLLGFALKVVGRIWLFCQFPVSYRPNLTSKPNKRKKFKKTTAYRTKIVDVS